MLTLHYLQYSQAIRVLWLLEELSDAANQRKDSDTHHRYNLKIYKRLADLQAPPELKSISPLGTSPVITISNNDDDDKKNNKDDIVLAESSRHP